MSKERHQFQIPRFICMNVYMKHSIFIFIFRVFFSPNSHYFTIVEQEFLSPSSPLFLCILTPDGRNFSSRIIHLYYTWERFVQLERILLWRKEEFIVPFSGWNQGGDSKGQWHGRSWGGQKIEKEKERKLRERDSRIPIWATGLLHVQETTQWEKWRQIFLPSHGCWDLIAYKYDGILSGNWLF